MYLFITEMLNCAASVSKKAKKAQNTISKIYGTSVQYVDPEYLRNHKELESINKLLHVQPLYLR